MEKINCNLLLADDDSDDCLFFKEALDGLPLDAKLTTVHDGIELMDYLTANEHNLPDALFLDLNMPRKSGFECLSEIRSNETFRHLPIIILTTSLDMDVVNGLYVNGAHYYIRKPGEFSTLKNVIFKAVSLTKNQNLNQPAKDQFILQA